MNLIFRSALLLALSVIFVSSTLFLPTSGQVTGGQDRIIESQSFPNEPVKITGVKAKKGLLKAGEKFKDADDWFKGLTLTIKNTSDKPVNYISALITFTRPQEQKDAGRIPFGEPLTYGVSPVDLKGSSGSYPAPSILPGESIELGLSEKDFAEFKSLLKRLDFPDAITRIEVSLQEVGFEEGLFWSGGEYWRRNPNNPDKFIPLSKRDGNVFFF